VHSNGKRTGPRLALTDRRPLALSWPLMLTDCLGKRPGRPMHARARHGHLTQRAGSGTMHSSLGAVVPVGKTRREGGGHAGRRASGEDSLSEWGDSKGGGGGVTQRYSTAGEELRWLAMICGRPCSSGRLVRFCFAARRRRGHDRPQWRR
jgi:hypothetical protein